jgi:hypothetical protein
MLRFRQLRLRSETNAGTYGVDIRFNTGLNIIRADNTMGKSTCLQALLYALGLERMLSPRREVPLPYVMTTHLDDPQTGLRHSVVQSSAWLEIENSAGTIITIRRGIVNANQKLVSVFDGPALTRSAGTYRQRDYFVLDPGAAQREAGFHHMIAQFIGWDLPTVSRYDGGEIPLYVETVFPLIYVEQKAGWASLPAAFPTYFQIRDIAKRALEFLLALDTHGVELARQQLQFQLAESQAAWAATREQALTVGAHVNARVEGLPENPTISLDDINRALLVVADGNGGQPLEVMSSALRARVAALQDMEVPTVEDVASQEQLELQTLSLRVGEENARRSALFRARETAQSQRLAIDRRLAALAEDLQKNLDSQKLRDIGSVIADVFAPDHCPTCAQPIADSLLAQRANAAVMPIDQTIEYIRAQRGLFQRLRKQTENELASIDLQLAAATAEVNETSARIRSLKADLLRSSHSPSLAAIDERVRAEGRLQALEEAQQRFEEQRTHLISLAARHSQILSARADLPNDRFTATDRRKLALLERLIREQTESYGFRTFPPNEIHISEDTYRPHKEGFEIGFELSASDSIRLKWAYQLALLEVGRTESTNHPGILVFDEPRQQETALPSFEHLLVRAAASKATGQQVLFATSEDRAQLERFLSGLDCRLIDFEGPILRRL